MPIFRGEYDACVKSVRTGVVHIVLCLLIAVVRIGIAVAQPSSQSEGITMEGISAVSLTAQHAASTDEVRIRYTIKNGSAADIYVLDGMPASNSTTREAFVVAGYYSLFLRDQIEAVVLVGVPPLPKGKLVTVRKIPLATRVASGADFTQELMPIPLPLTERSPYMTAEELRRLESTTVNRLSLAVQFLSASTPKIEVASVPYDATHVAVSSPRTIDDLKEVKVMIEQKDMVFRVLPGPR
jgi:hypothetical protein